MERNSDQSISQPTKTAPDKPPARRELQSAGFTKHPLCYRTFVFVTGMSGECVCVCRLANFDNFTVGGVSHLACLVGFFLSEWSGGFKSLPLPGTDL